MALVKRTILVALVITAMVLISVNPATAAVGSKRDTDWMSSGDFRITITVTGYYYYGQDHFFEVVHTFTMVKPPFYGFNGAWGVYGEDTEGELYSETLLTSQTTYTYDDEPYVDSSAHTWCYGVVFWFGFPVATADLYCEILADM
ncbi:MAG: hypothetical protein ACFFER_16175 [Candidatus Thorarchaeota archaeon]